MNWLYFWWELKPHLLMSHSHQPNGLFTGPSRMRTKCRFCVSEMVFIFSLQGRVVRAFSCWAGILISTLGWIYRLLQFSLLCRFNIESICVVIRSVCVSVCVLQEYLHQVFHSILCICFSNKHELFWLGNCSKLGRSHLGRLGQTRVLELDPSGFG